MSDPFEMPQEPSDYAPYEESPARVETVIKFSQSKRSDDKAKAQSAPSNDSGGVKFDDFVAYMPTHSFVYIPTREMWPGSSVDDRLPSIKFEDGKSMKASQMLAKKRPVEQMTWAPGEEMLIRDRLVADGGWINHPGVTCFNLYRPAIIKPGDAGQAGPWIDHVRRVYPDDADHLMKWFAHRVQRPGEKINHAIVMGGNQGIGKDTTLEPVKQAIGPWNFSEVSPAQMLGRFNGFVKSVILRVSEARDLGDVDRYAFYEHMKPLTAAPPDVLRVDEKNLREHSVFNVCGAVITTNHKTDGIYLPADDRRHYVAWSDLTKSDFNGEYWNKLWAWYETGGLGHVAAYLRDFDLSGFNPKAPPPKTAAFWAIVDAGRAPEDAELSDVLDGLNNPAAVTLGRICHGANEQFAEWLRDRKNRRVIPHRLEQCGYVPVRNDAAKDGLWKIGGARQAVYGKASMSVRDRLRAATAIAADR
jgi:hypothetical protein